MVKESVIRHSIILSLFWTGILFLPIGRSWWIGTFSQEYQFYMVCWLLGVTLFPVQFYLYRQSDLDQGTWRCWFIGQLVIGVGIASFYQYYIDQHVITKSIRIHDSDWQGIVANTATVRFVSGDAFSVFYLYFIHASLGIIWLYNIALTSRKLNELSLKNRLTASQIKLLQTEFQPHFIFNTLHTANSLMEEDVAKAQLLLEKFAYLHRHYLSIVNHQFYMLEEEIDFLREYIEVQQIRSSTSILMQTNASTINDNILVPVIFLQPIIENAIKHGWHNRQLDFIIDIQIRVHEGYCEFKIVDSGAPLEQEISEGIGLRNLRDRLTVLYENDFFFNYEFVKGKFSTTIRIPVVPSSQFLEVLV
jgi:anti-sigma regulatory factor (Ser/Thr protein kinase)